jgi:hypothetical protein
MLGRWLLFCVALGASWATHARADFNLGADDDALDDAPPQVTATPPVATPTPKRAPLFEIHAPSAGYGNRPFHLELVTGVATKVGVLGLAGEYDLGNPLSVGAGIGSNILGTDWEIHARVRPVYSLTPNGSFFSALTVEGAFARSVNTNTNLDIGFTCNDDDNGECADPSALPQTVYWAQAELGWEGMFRNGLTLRVATGAARELGSPTWQCKLSGQIVPCTSLPDRTLFVQTFAVGYAF